MLQKPDPVLLAIVRWRVPDAHGAANLYPDNQRGTRCVTGQQAHPHALALAAIAEAGFPAPPGRASTTVERAR